MPDQLAPAERSRLQAAGYKEFNPRPMFPELAGWIHQHTQLRLTLEEARAWCRLETSADTAGKAGADRLGLE